MIDPSQTLAERTILVAPRDRDLANELTHQNARVLTWPQIEIAELDAYTALDDAIENLFGYDWLIFANAYAPEFFLRRLQHLGHEVSELDALRVCALDDAARQVIEQSRVHLDLVPEQCTSEGVMAALGTYTGGRDSLRGLNFLFPRAAISRDPLWGKLEDAGARVDIVAAYRTALNNSQLVQLGVLLAGGGVDGVAFTNPATLSEFAQLLDTNDLSRVLKEVVVACADEATAQAAAKFGIGQPVVPAEPGVAALISAITVHLATGQPEKNRLQ